jgi:hypothetical protein
MYVTMFNWRAVYLCFVCLCLVSCCMCLCITALVSSNGYFHRSRNCLPFRSTWVHPRFLLGSCYLIISCMCMFCRSLFVLLLFFFWSLCCLFFFSMQIVIHHLVSASSSFYTKSWKCEILTSTISLNMRCVAQRGSRMFCQHKIQF